MDIDSLRRFLVIAEEQNLTRAAERLFVSQPTLSRAVRSMEREVGALLFERHARSVSLTPAGQSLAEDAERLIQEFEAAIARARTTHLDSAPPDDEPCLRVGLFYPSAAELTRPILNAFRSSHPDTRLQSVDLTSRGGEHALVSGIVDVAFLWSPVASSELLAVALFEDSCVALVPPTHQLADREAVTIPELADERYTVTGGLSERWQTASTLEPWLGRPEQAVTVGTVTDALEAVAHGEAITIGPRSLSRYAPIQGINYIPLTGQTGPTSMLCMRRNDRRRLTRQFVALGASLAGLLLPTVPGARRLHSA